MRSPKRALEEEHPDLKDPDVTAAREIPTDDSELRYVGNPVRTIVLDSRSPEKMSTMEKLRVVKNRAIVDQDYEQSDLIDEYIQLLKHEDTAEVTKKAKQWLTDVLNKTVERCTDNQRDIEEEYEENKMEVVEEYDRRLETMKTRHVDDRAALYAERELVIAHEQTRTPGEYTTMMQQAHRHARGGNTKAAKVLRVEAEGVRAEQIERNVADVAMRFDRLISALVVKQEKEVVAMFDARDHQIQEQDRLCGVKKDEQRKRADVYIYHVIRNTTESTLRVIKRLSAREGVTSELTRCAQKVLSTAGW